MCAWPKGKPRGKKSPNVKEYDLEAMLDSTDVVENSIQDDETTSDVVLIDTEGVYGLKTYKYGYELYVRRKFLKDTVIEIKVPATAEIRKTLFRAGEFGPWQLAAKPFHGKLDTLLVSVHQMMVKDRISESLSIKNLEGIIRESEGRILKTISA
jgi:hypothetical protein